MDALSDDADKRCERGTLGSAGALEVDVHAVQVLVAHGADELVRESCESVGVMQDRVERRLVELLRREDDGVARSVRTVDEVVERSARVAVPACALALERAVAVGIETEVRDRREIRVLVAGLRP